MAAQDIPPFPIPLPAPDSLRVADAAAWYRATVPLILDKLDDGLDDAERFDQAWQMKSRIRLAAALSLYDQELVEEFFHEFPLPCKATLLGRALAWYDEESLEAFALRSLIAISPKEQRAFPGTVGEAIGMEIWDGKQTFIMTENGWQPKPC